MLLFYNLSVINAYILSLIKILYLYSKLNETDMISPRAGVNKIAVKIAHSDKQTN